MLEEKARKIACKAHDDVGQQYDSQSYSVHLKMVADYAKKFIHLIPENERDEVIASAWLHDIIEDARFTYNDVKKEFGEVVAEYVYALTNEKGRTRKDRANDKYYKGIKEYKHATFIKVCDRYANTLYSKDTGSPMFLKYKKEHLEFESKLWDNRYSELWEELEKLYN